MGGAPVGRVVSVRQETAGERRSGGGVSQRGCRFGGHRRRGSERGTLRALYDILDGIRGAQLRRDAVRESGGGAIWDAPRTSDVHARRCAGGSPRAWASARRAPGGPVLP